MSGDRLDAAPPAGPTRRALFGDRWPVAALVAVALIVFAPVLFGGKTLYPTDITNGLILPFAAGKAEVNVQATALSDYVLYYFPVRYVQAASFRSGTLNLWNPYIFGGQPAYANNASIVAFDPFNALLLLPDLGLGLAWRSFLQVVACMLFMYLYLRHLALGRTPSLIGSLGYSLNSMFWANAFDWSIAGMLWLPLVCLFVDRAVATRSIRWIAAAALVTGVALLASPLQIYFYICLTVLAVQGLQWMVLSRDLRQLTTVVSVCGVVLAVAVAMTAVQLLPSFELYGQSARFADGALQATGKRARTLSETVVATAALSSFVFPNLAGRAKESMVVSGVLWGGEAHWQGFIGVLPFFLAAIGGLASSDRRRLPFVALALGGVVAVVYTPVGRILYERFFIVYIFAAAVLAAFGCQALIVGGLNARPARRALAGVAALTGMVFAALASATIAMVFAGQSIRAAVERRVLATLSTNYFGSSYPDLYFQKANTFLDDLMLWSPHTAVPLAIAVASLTVIAWRLNGRVTGRALVPAVIAITAIDLVFMTVTHVPFVDLERNPFTPASPAIELVQKEAGLGRVMSHRVPAEPPVLPLGLASTYGLYAADGNDNLGPPNLSALVSFVGEPCGGERCVTPIGSRLAGVRHFFVGPKTRLPAERFDLIYDREVRVYRDRGPVERAFWVSRYEVVPDTAAAIARARSADFDARREVVLDRAPDAHIAATEHSGRARIVEHAASRVTLQVSSPAAGLVVLADTFYPGWQARLDGRSVPVLRANGVMRAVPVGAGEHTLTFEYVPASFRLGAVVSLASLGVALGAFCLTFLPRPQLVAAASRA